jgi:hypothetical protein
VQKTLFAVSHKAQSRSELGTLKSLNTLKMESICSPETWGLAIATRYKVPEDIFQVTAVCEDFTAP